MNRTGWSVLALALLLLPGTTALGTTWAEVAVECPLCGASNNFHDVASYGSYIYDWPSKYQLIFWPTTVDRVLRACLQCRYTALLGDFLSLPEAEHEAVRQALADISFPAEARTYLDVPMDRRLEAAERVYRALDRGDDFWCLFYRIAGYHRAADGLAEKARENRTRARELARSLAESDENAGQRKEYLLVAGAMSVLLADAEAARGELTAAMAAEYRLPEMSDEEVAGANEYLDGIATDLLQGLAAPAGDGEQPPEETPPAGETPPNEEAPAEETTDAANG